MIKSIHIIIFSILISLISKESCNAQDHYYSSFCNVKQRALAMGGAFTSITDDLEAVYYNPANFNLYRTTKNFRITFFINPVLPYIALKSYSNNFTKDINEKDIWEAVSLFLKGIVITTKFLDTAFIFKEASILNCINDKNFFDFDPKKALEVNANTLVTSFKFAKRASIGVSGTYYYTKNIKDVKNWLGYSYGILLNPNDRLNVGLAYVDYPDEVPNFRFPLERMKDETMNIGASYKLTSSTIFSVDVRNLTEEQKENVRELHFGLEQSIFAVAALRCGFFKGRYSKDRYYSLGIGLIDANSLFKKDNSFKHPNYLIDYSFIYYDKVDSFSRYHLLSFIMRI